MRLLYSVGRPAYPFMIGGDGTIAHTILAEFAGRGGEGRFLGTLGAHLVAKLGRLDRLGVAHEYSGDTLSYRIPYGVLLATRDGFLGHVRRAIAEFRPDVVLSQLNESREILDLARRHGCATALYVLDVDHAENFRALEDGPDVVLAVSGFVQDELRSRFGRDSDVLYPPIDFREYWTDRAGNFVTMVNPTEVKGVEIALELASRMSDREFLFVEGWGTDPAITERIARLPNARHLGKQVDMRPVYAATEVLIVPSRWSEAFGRVVVEAQASGIPVVASRTGGLPEAVGRGGILVDDHRSPDAWESELRGLLGDPAAYERLSGRAVENTRRFDLKEGMDRLMALLEGRRNT